MRSVLTPLPLAIGAFALASSLFATQPTLPEASLQWLVVERPTPAPRQIIGSTIADWKGIQPLNQEATEGTLSIPGDAVFTSPKGPVGPRNYGFDLRHDGTFDWRPYELLQFQIKLAEGREGPSGRGEEGRVFEGRVSIAIPTNPNAGAPGSFPNGEVFPFKNYVPLSQAQFHVHGSGWQTVSIPVESFDYPRGQEAFLKYIQQVRLGGQFRDGKPGRIQLKGIALIRGETFAVDAPIKGKAAEAGKTVEYSVSVENTSLEPQSLTLAMRKIGWEAMEARIEPESMRLAAGESRVATVRVQVSPRVVPGGYESHTLVVTANGASGQARKVEFLTSRKLAAPYLIHTTQGWKQVRAKAANYPWAKAAMEKIVNEAKQWKVPTMGVMSADPQPELVRPALMHAKDLNQVQNLGVAYCLTKDRELGEKIAKMFRALADPKNGYPKTLQVTEQGLVQEGAVFQFIAATFDAIQDDGFLSDEDKANIEWCFRRFMGIMDEARATGAVSNWTVAQNTGALFCALALQDRERVHHWLYAPSGVIDQFVKGTTDDGWWYEMSVSYNTWVASENSQIALALRPFGIDLASMRFPASYSPTWDLRPLFNPPQGLPLEKRFQGRWQEIGGPTTRNYRSIRDLWDGPMSFVDYRGVIFGVNDSQERKVGGEPYELAYSLFGDPKYAEMVRRLGGERSLIYGVPELPDTKSDLASRSACADNAGVTLLRSQTASRPQSEQIQAVIKYSTQGGSHGHYDRNDLLSIMRYGRSFWSPESVWYSYLTPLYVMLAQSSPMHNMVVADLKTQEPVDSPRLLFHSGTMMQAVATESVSRFAYPPCLSGWENWKQMSERQHRPIPMPEKLPPLGMMSQPTEPILQRRAMVVTDDYIVVADYEKAEKEHTFDWLLHPQGFQSLEGRNKKPLKEEAFMDTDPLGSARFIVNAKWYQLEAPTLARFATNFQTRDSRTQSEPGALKLDVHSLWPRTQEIMIAKSPVDEDGAVRIAYAIRAGDKVLDQGQFDSWILGKREIDIPVEGLKELAIETAADKKRRNTIFWGNARIVTADGKEIPLLGLVPQLEGIEPNPHPGNDYYGGPVIIEGVEYPNSLGAQPTRQKTPGVIRVNLAGKNAARFKATLGSDFFTADAATERKVFSSRVKGTEARFLTVIEPYEKDAAIKSAIAEGADKLRVELKDGRSQEITFSNLTGSGKEIAVRIVESKDGKIVRQENSNK